MAADGTFEQQIAVFGESGSGKTVMVSSMQLPAKVAQNLMVGAGGIAAVLTGRKAKLPGKLGMLLKVVGSSTVDDAVTLAGDRLQQVNAEAQAKRDHLTATLTRFRMDLEQGEEEHVLVLSRR